MLKVAFFCLKTTLLLRKVNEHAILILMKLHFLRQLMAKQMPIAKLINNPNIIILLY